MAITANRSFEYIAGDDIRLSFTVTDLEGIPADIASVEIRVAICDVETHEVILSTEGGSPGGSIETDLTDPDYGLFDATVAGNYTADLLGTYEWQAKIDDTDTATATVGQGFITFSRSLLPAV